MDHQSLNEQADALCALVLRTPQRGARFLLAIAGPPASGKSSLAERVVETLNRDALHQAALVPMDGFHLDNPILDERGLRWRKGAPETFNSRGYCRLLSELVSEREEVFAPRFDRDLDAAVANAIRIGPETDILVAEGNYLLLDEEPWTLMREHFSASVLLAPSRETLRQRLEARWYTYGLKGAKLAAQLESDMANIDTVLERSTKADVTLR